MVYRVIAIIAIIISATIIIGSCSTDPSTAIEMKRQESIGSKADVYVKTLLRDKVIEKKLAMKRIQVYDDITGGTISQEGKYSVNPIPFRMSSPSPSS